MDAYRRNSGFKRGVLIDDQPYTRSYLSGISPEAEMMHDLIEAIIYDRDYDGDMLSHLRGRGSPKDFLKIDSIKTKLDHILDVFTPP